MKKIAWVAFFIFAASCLSCANSGSIYQPSSYSFTIKIPAGWRKIDNNRYLFVTKESPFLQYVMVQNRPISRSFRHTEKTLNTDMLPEEAAQIIVDEIASDKNILNFKVLNNTPAAIQGHDGFKILFTYNDKKGSKFRTLYYGFIKEDTFFNLRFNAADQVYFQKDVETFKRMLNSFQVIKAKSA